MYVGKVRQLQILQSTCMRQVNIMFKTLSLIYLKFYNTALILLKRNDIDPGAMYIGKVRQLQILQSTCMRQVNIMFKTLSLIYLKFYNTALILLKRNDIDPGAMYIGKVRQLQILQSTCMRQVNILFKTLSLIYLKFYNTALILLKRNDIDPGAMYIGKVRQLQILQSTCMRQVNIMFKTLSLIYLKFYNTALILLKRKDIDPGAMYV